MPTGVYTRKSMGERFWGKVDMRGPDECWPWMASIFKDAGYGQFRIAGTGVGAHRMAYALTKGPIPAGLEVLHDCDNRLCCNPAHLWTGTKADNRQDCVAKGRQAFGERQGSAKLTEDQVREIRQLHSEGKNLGLIAGSMNVSKQNISYIVRGVTWKHILPEAR